MKKSILGLMALASLAACSSTRPEQAAQPAAPQVLPPFVFTKEVQNAPVVGKGNVGYRFILLQPNSNQPAAKQAFVLAYPGSKLPFATAGSDVYQGVTDERGMTPVFAFENNVPEQGFVLLPMVGQGKQGGWVLLQDNQQPMRGQPYSMAVCEAKPYLFSALTNSAGQTAYVATSNQKIIARLLPYSNDLTVRQQQLDTACPPQAKKAAASKRKRR